MAEYVVPMKFKVSGEAFVEADSAEEARQKADAGGWSHIDTSAGETTDWNSTGPAKLND